MSEKRQIRSLSPGGKRSRTTATVRARAYSTALARARLWIGRKHLTRWSEWTSTPIPEQYRDYSAVVRRVIHTVQYPTLQRQYLSFGEHAIYLPPFTFERSPKELDADCLVVAYLAWLGVQVHEPDLYVKFLKTVFGVAAACLLSRHTNYDVDVELARKVRRELKSGRPRPRSYETAMAGAALEPRPYLASRVRNLLSSTWNLERLGLSTLANSGLMQIRPEHPSWMLPAGRFGYTFCGLNRVVKISVDRIWCGQEELMLQQLTELCERHRGKGLTGPLPEKYIRRNARLVLHRFSIAQNLSQAKRAFPDGLGSLEDAEEAAGRMLVGDDPSPMHKDLVCAGSLTLHYLDSEPEGVTAEHVEEARSRLDLVDMVISCLAETLVPQEAIEASEREIADMTTSFTQTEDAACEGDIRQRPGLIDTDLLTWQSSMSRFESWASSACDSGLNIPAAPPTQSRGEYGHSRRKGGTRAALDELMLIYSTAGEKGSCPLPLEEALLPEYIVRPQFHYGETWAERLSRWNVPRIPARLAGIYDAGKTRTVSAATGATQFFGKIILEQVLAKVRRATPITEFSNGPVDERKLNRHFKRGWRNGSVISGDFTAATDSLCAVMSELWAHNICVHAQLPPKVEGALISILTRHNFELSDGVQKQRRGQLMGSHASFPILNLSVLTVSALAWLGFDPSADYSGNSWVDETPPVDLTNLRPRVRRFLKRFRGVINGDDLADLMTEAQYCRWQRWCEYVGWEFSASKNWAYRLPHPEQVVDRGQIGARIYGAFGTFSSVGFVVAPVDEDFNLKTELLPWANPRFSAMETQGWLGPSDRGPSKLTEISLAGLGEAGRRTIFDGRITHLLPQARRQLIRRHRRLLIKVNYPLEMVGLPTSVGGLGWRGSADLTLTDFERALARRILSTMGPFRRTITLPDFSDPDDVSTPESQFVKQTYRDFCKAYPRTGWEAEGKVATDVAPILDRSTLVQGIMGELSASTDGSLTGFLGELTRYEYVSRLFSPRGAGSVRPRRRKQPSSKLNSLRRLVSTVKRDMSKTPREPIRFWNGERMMDAHDATLFFFRGEELVNTRALAETTTRIFERFGAVTLKHLLCFDVRAWFGTHDRSSETNVGDWGAPVCTTVAASSIGMNRRILQDFEDFESRAHIELWEEEGTAVAPKRAFTVRPPLEEEGGAAAPAGGT